jgi:anti-sigma regulatory factor (Ser/Thr protein kinase)
MSSDADRTANAHTDQGTNQMTGTQRRLTLRGVTDPVGAGRDFARLTLKEWSWPPAGAGVSPVLAGDVALVVSELLTNAALHGNGPVELVLRLSGQAVLRIEVADTDPGVPEPRQPHQPGVPGGHGLHIVEKICDSWGVVPYDGGKTVWSEIRPGGGL